MLANPIALFSHIAAFHILGTRSRTAFKGRDRPADSQEIRQSRRFLDAVLGPLPGRVYSANTKANYQKSPPLSTTPSTILFKYT